MALFFHPFHIVTKSPWPLFGGVGALSFLSACLVLFKQGSLWEVVGAFFFLSLFSAFWWRDVSREGVFLGEHPPLVQQNLKVGMFLFIFSEVLFFMGWFWAFFHHSGVPAFEGGGVWPPLYVVSFDPFSIPLLNTGLLLSSGLFVTWAHHNLLVASSMEIPLLITVVLGAFFSYFQWMEYWEAPFSIGEGAYGTVFFLSTGFHGGHVLVGAIFLGVCLWRAGASQLSPFHHLGFEFAVWYWHFVDVVWLFLFSFIYYWSS